MSVTQSQMIELLQICDVRYKNLFEGYIFVEFLERAKGFEPSTSTLARLLRTNIEKIN